MYRQLFERQISELHKLTPKHVAIYAGLSQAKFADFLNGRRDLDAESLMLVNRLLESLIQLRDLARPLPVDFGEVATIRECLHALENGDPLSPRHRLKRIERVEDFDVSSKSAEWIFVVGHNDAIQFRIFATYFPRT